MAKILIFIMKRIKMNKIQEDIIRIKKLMNESEELDEGLLDTIKDFLSRISKSEPVTKIKDKLKDIFDIDGDETDIAKITTSDDDFYDKVLDCLGAPKTYSNKLFFYAWRQAEGGTAKNNPFNTTYKRDLKKDQYDDYNSVGVKNYANRYIGIEATCKTLKIGKYSDIVDALKSGDAFDKIDKMKSLKTWGTGDLLVKVANSYKEGSTPKPNPIA